MTNTPAKTERLERIEWDVASSCLLVHMSGGGECISLTAGLPASAVTGRLSELVQRLHTNCRRRGGGEAYRWTTQKDSDGLTLAYSWDGTAPDTGGLGGRAVADLVQVPTEATVALCALLTGYGRGDGEDDLDYLSERDRAVIVERGRAHWARILEIAARGAFAVDSLLTTGRQVESEAELRAAVGVLASPNDQTKGGA